jgi:hypothetical protein
MRVRDDGTYMPHDMILDTGGDAQETLRRRRSIRKRNRQRLVAVEGVAESTRARRFEPAG